MSKSKQLLEGINEFITKNGDKKYTLKIREDIADIIAHEIVNIDMYLTGIDLQKKLIDNFTHFYGVPFKTIKNDFYFITPEWFIVG